MPSPSMSSSNLSFTSSFPQFISRFFYLSPLPSPDNLPIYILNISILIQSDADYSAFLELFPKIIPLLPQDSRYILIVLSGQATSSDHTFRKSFSNPSIQTWLFQLYQSLSHALKSNLQRVYFVHDASWFHDLLDLFSSIVRRKFKRKLLFFPNLASLSTHIPVENLLIPPSIHLLDSSLVTQNYDPSCTSIGYLEKRAFGARYPLPFNSEGITRLPRILRETTSFLLFQDNYKIEGIFRIPAHNKLRDILKDAYNRGQKFIIWKDSSKILPLWQYYGLDDLEPLIQNLDPRDCYDVHMAASLIKLWYSDLRQPIIPSSSYFDLLTKLLSREDQSTFSLNNLVEIFSPNSSNSPLPLISRKILSQHLLPLLSEIVKHESSNLMSAANLSVCIVPTFLRGSNPSEDAKLFSQVRILLQRAIEAWANEGLRDACGLTEDDFFQALLPPENPVEYEDFTLDTPSNFESNNLYHQRSNASRNDPLSDSASHEYYAELQPPSSRFGQLGTCPSSPSLHSSAYNLYSTSSNTNSELEAPKLRGSSPYFRSRFSSIFPFSSDYLNIVKTPFNRFESVIGRSSLLSRGSTVAPINSQSSSVGGQSGKVHVEPYNGVNSPLSYKSSPRELSNWPPSTPGSDTYSSPLQHSDLSSPWVPKSTILSKSVSDLGFASAKSSRFAVHRSSFFRIRKASGEQTVPDVASEVQSISRPFLDSGEVQTPPVSHGFDDVPEVPESGESVNSYRRARGTSILGIDRTSPSTKLVSLRQKHGKRLRSLFTGNVKTSQGSQCEMDGSNSLYDNIPETFPPPPTPSSILNHFPEPAYHTVDQFNFSSPCQSSSLGNLAQTNNHGKTMAAGVTCAALPHKATRSKRTTMCGSSVVSAPISPPIDVVTSKVLPTLNNGSSPRVQHYHLYSRESSRVSQDRRCNLLKHGQSRDACCTNGERYTFCGSTTAAPGEQQRTVIPLFSQWHESCSAVSSEESKSERSALSCSSSHTEDIEASSTLSVPVTTTTAATAVPPKEKQNVHRRQHRRVPTNENVRNMSRIRIIDPASSMDGNMELHLRRFHLDS